MDGRIGLLIPCLGLLLAATACQQPLSCVAVESPAVTMGQRTVREASSNVECYDSNGELVSINGNRVVEMEGKRVICHTYTHQASQRLTERCVTLDGEVVRDAYISDPPG